jgi:hypothetical protein
MNTRYRLKNPNTMIHVGLVFLILANLWKYVVTSRALLSERLTDGTTGLLFGVSIGCLLLGIWLKNHRRSDGSGARA